MLRYHCNRDTNRTFHRIHGMFLATSLAVACDGVDESEDARDAEEILDADLEEEAALPEGPDELAAAERDTSLPFGWSATVEQGKYHTREISKTKGKSYQICVTPFTGDPDVYGHWAFFPTTSSYQYKSTHAGLSVDCLPTFKATESGSYYISVYGYKKSNFSVDVTVW